MFNKKNKCDNYSLKPKSRTSKQNECDLKKSMLVVPLLFTNRNETDDLFGGGERNVKT